MHPSFLPAIVSAIISVIGLAFLWRFIFQSQKLTTKLSRARARVAKLLAAKGKLFDLVEVDYSEYGTMTPAPRCLATSRMILEYMEGPLIDLKSFRALIDTSRGTYHCANVTMLTKDMTPGKECVSVTFSTDVLIPGWVNGFVILNERGDCMDREDYERRGQRIDVKAQDTFRFTYHMKN